MAKNAKVDNIAKDNVKFFKWIQEYTKKIITLTFILYLVINLFILFMISITYFHSGDIQSLDTLISEINITFRDVIGGYIIKAAAENAIKITGGIFDKWLEYKTIQIENSSSRSEEYIDEDESERNEDKKGVNLKWLKR